ncbi:hypothetical protein FSP39_023409 [Pinctada imbricata]|uniref:P/Homo B domain-containing protein n=1 Tax=Pinctada imbricata TaxID=66713 RepID=A0AA88YGG5_PINIB|nr:hypothetical protein FSP39_023409 [Pinctada imbricata]
MGGGRRKGVGGEEIVKGRDRKEGRGGRGGPKMRFIVLVSVLSLFLVSAIPVSTNDDNPHYLNQFLIKVEKRAIADEIAKEHGFEVKEELDGLGYFLLEHPTVTRRSKRYAENHVENLKSDSRVEYAEQQKVLIREKRDIVYDKQLELESRDYDPSEYYRVKTSRMYRRGKFGDGDDDLVFNDKFYGDQWYVKNTGQSGGNPDVDLNVMVAWKYGYTGVGVNVVVLDDGIDHTHIDLAENYNKDVSADFNDPNDKENDPTPNKSDSSNSHGTKCAGEIAAVANNGICAVGVAYGAKVGGIRILDGDVTDHLEAKALNYMKNDIHITSASWGPRDNGATMEMPGRATREALQRGVREEMVASMMTTVVRTAYVSSIETLSIGSASDRGQAPYFMETCSSTFAVVPSGGEVYSGEYHESRKPKIKVVTTDINNGCTLGFQGTSAAAPLAAGCVALALQANPDLTWRDVQHIIASTSRIPSVDKSWDINGAGMHVSHTFGFGVMDCGRMVEAALEWKRVPEQHICRSEIVNVDIPMVPRDCIQHEIQFPMPCQRNNITTIRKTEHVEVYVKLEHTHRGDVELFITSPSGKISRLLAARKNDHATEGVDFWFMTIHHWNEMPEGEWNLVVCDNEKSLRRNSGRLLKYQFVWYGTNADVKDGRSHGKAYKPSLAKVEEMEKKELERAKRLKIKRQEGKKRENSPTSKDGKSGIQEKRQHLMEELTNILSRRGFDEDNVEDALKDLGTSKTEKKSYFPSNKDQIKRKLETLQERTTSNSIGKDSRGYETAKKERIDELYNEVLDRLGRYIERRENEKKLPIAERYLSLIDKRERGRVNHEKKSWNY